VRSTFVEACLQEMIAGSTFGDRKAHCTSATTGPRMRVSADNVVVLLEYPWM
jgi:hypothetical protein